MKRRAFVRSSLAAALVAPGALTFPELAKFRRHFEEGLELQQDREAEYDALAKLGNNENAWGPSEPVMKAMMKAFKYANRYGYPDGGIVAELAKHHGVKNENILITAGSGELLSVVGVTFLQGNHLKVLGVDPTYGSVYQLASNIRAEAVRVPLLPDYTQDIPALIKAAKVCCHEIGFVYLVNPNNPTGRIVPKEEVRQLLDGIPEGMPVLVDEAYHHFVQDPAYATAVPYVLEGRPVIIARTFSKLWGLAGMRLGYAVAPRELIQKMRPYATGTVNAIVKWGGVAALKDTEGQERVIRDTIALRTKTTTELNALGYSTIPSEGNFFMVAIKRPVQPVIQEFRQRGVIVGRPFPPMTEHLRVSIGTAEEMGRFMTAWKQIFPAVRATNGAKGG